MLKTNLKLLKPIILNQLNERLKNYFPEMPKKLQLTIVTSKQETELINKDTNEALILKNTNNDSLVKNLERFLNAKINCIIAEVSGGNITISFYYETKKGEKLTKTIDF